jgi:hypothetical protein
MAREGSGKYRRRLHVSVFYPLGDDVRAMIDAFFELT